MEANNATMIEYIIKLDIAKEMAMLECNDKGKQVRRYFIEVEKEYKGQRVVTFKDIDMVHEKADGTANKRFLDNKKHFVSEEDYFVVSNSEIRKSHIIPLSDNDYMDKTLITESGYLMLVKSFKDDLAWKVQRKLVNTYFKVKNNTENLIMPKDYPSALRSLADEYEKRQLVEKENNELD